MRNLRRGRTLAAAAAALVLIGGLYALTLRAAEPAGDGAAAPQATEPAGQKADAPDWHQWRGPHRNGITSESGFRTDLQDVPELWRRDVGIGFSTVSVADGRLYTMGNVDHGRRQADVVSCLNAKTGKPIWRKTYPCKRGGHAGTRCTPTVDGERVYTLSREGHLICWRAADGQKLWAKHLRKDFGQKPSSWGFACSPVVHGEMLLLDAGATLALDKATGRKKWASDDFRAGYSSPVIFTFRDTEFVASFNGWGLVVVRLEDGKELGRFRWKTAHGVNAIDPVVWGDKIFIASGYGTGCALVQVTEDGLTELWRKKAMASHFASPVLVNGHVYGSHGQVGSRGSKLQCLNLATGEVKWSKGGLRMTSQFLADGKLFALGDGGMLVVAEATPQGFKRLGAAKPLGGKCWNVPVLCDGLLYVRNNAGTLVCLDLRKGEADGGDERREHE